MFFPLLALGAGFLLASRGKKSSATRIESATLIGTRSGLTYQGEHIPQTRSLVLRYYPAPGVLTAEMSLIKQDDGRWHLISARGEQSLVKKMLGDFNVIEPPDIDAPEPPNEKKPP